ncbi:MAG: Rpn family recombination-promoting nuclease/putative transposase [Sandaracinaceae bacterium]|jgi:predicted transposase YdaD|nr:Rpn family recombination-promoting nuclease/putative transposase [Sandaracinaceae bacterium]MBP7680508.1 Rpn family recombination-promoting nuclease/putative transposase [Deltaproteobacteria bacterium]MBK7156695.1 Rpn family recombination-promoting nuclease/putative transposase [Sandaracinaceae bacterium]MBK7778508.1 Rpn family recombination-promoting nuclease/putative transposase [Sandaracinaceae bacterium]MBK8412436.1 Rpn family recombination-promoting nuclease/putative transposase [Sandar
MGDHDGLFKRIFGVPTHAADMLRSVLPAALVAALDLTRLELIPGSFVSPSMAHRHSDLLFRVPLGDKLIYLHIIIEHQSWPHPLMPLRVLEYTQLVWASILREQPDRKTLPPVMTLVVHHGPSGWTAPRSLHEMVEGLDQFPELRPFVPNLELRIEDLVFVSDQDLFARPLAPVPQVALWLLRDGRDLTALLARIVAWRAVFARVLVDFPDEARVFVRYILLTVGPHSYEAVRQAILEHIPAAEAPLATIADQLRQEGLQQGLQQGRQEGLGALRDTLRVLLAQRFGELDASYHARIEAAEVRELQRLAQRVMLATELADVFATH